MVGGPAVQCAPFLPLPICAGLLARPDVLFWAQSGLNGRNEECPLLRKERAVCTENLIRVDEVTESPKLAE